MRGCGRRVRVPRWVFTRRRQATRARQTVGHATGTCSPSSCCAFPRRVVFLRSSAGTALADNLRASNTHVGRTGIADGTCTSTGARLPPSVLTPAVPVFSAVCHQAQP